MKKFLILCLLLICAIKPIFTQDDDYYSLDEDKEVKKKENKENKWLFGGNLGMSFGTITYIELSPLAMYKISPRLMAGPGLVYIYEKDKTINYESSTYGIRALATYSLFKNLDESIGLNIGDIILHAENEYINKDLYYIDANGMLINKGPGWIDNLLIGGGLYQPFGNRGGGMAILVLFDVTQNKYSSYTNPVIELGFFF